MEPRQLIEKYRTSGAVVDTNLLVLLAVGLYRPARISTFNRTRQYTQEDFDLLRRLVSLFHRRIVTPHILAEADNLARQLPTNEHHAVAASMRHLIATSFEVYCPSSAAAEHERFPLIGLTDCTIVSASTKALVITDDLRLSAILLHLGHDAININHIRTLGWS